MISLLVFLFWFLLLPPLNCYFSHNSRHTVHDMKGLSTWLQNIPKFSLINHSMESLHTSIHQYWCAVLVTWNEITMGSPDLIACIYHNYERVCVDSIRAVQNFETCSICPVMWFDWCLLISLGKSFHFLSLSSCLESTLNSKWRLNFLLQCKAATGKSSETLYPRISFVYLHVMWRRVNGRAMIDPLSYIYNVEEEGSGLIPS